MAEIIEITDYNAPELDAYARLTEAQIRNRADPADGLFIAESPVVIQRALDAGCEPVSLLAERKHLSGDALPVLRRCPDLPVYTAELPILEQITGYKLTRGVLCAMRRPPEREVRDVLAGARRIAVLEEIMNPTNLGAIFRSAAALGADAILLTPGSCDPLYRRCVRVSMGTVFQIPWTYLGTDAADWPGPGLAELRRQGFTTTALTLSPDSEDLRNFRPGPEENVALLFGSEGPGLKPETEAACDRRVRIPMAHGVDSLNVAAAAAVAFWALQENQDQDKETEG
jgi:tRNA G18 (ribose-2'-O)-methylase SpoU